MTALEIIVPVKGGIKGREMQQLIILHALLCKKPTLELRVLLHMIRHSENGKFAVQRGYRDQMAKEVSSTSVSLRNSLNQLVMKGLIQYISNGKGSNLGSYKIHWALQCIRWEDERFVFKFYPCIGEHELQISHTCT